MLLRGIVLSISQSTRISYTITENSSKWYDLLFWAKIFWFFLKFYFATFSMHFVLKYLDLFPGRYLLLLQVWVESLTSYQMVLSLFYNFPFLGLHQTSCIKQNHINVKSNQTWFPLQKVWYKLEKRQKKVQ